MTDLTVSRTIPKEDKNISPLLRESQGSLNNRTKPNVTPSAGDPQDLRSVLNSKRREYTILVISINQSQLAVYRQDKLQEETMDPRF